MKEKETGKKKEIQGKKWNWKSKKKKKINIRSCKITFLHMLTAHAYNFFPFYTTMYARGSQITAMNNWHPSVKKINKNIPNSCEIRDFWEDLELPLRIAKKPHNLKKCLPLVDLQSTPEKVHNVEPWSEAKKKSHY